MMPHIRDYVLDWGEPHHVVRDGKDLGTGRYGAWVDVVGLDDKGNFIVAPVEMSDDLEYLQKKYGPGLPVVPK